ncbi:3-oxoacyl-[acyl-carrier-protein] synthase III C-terminal domain-containing protein [Actinomadura terrae]|uniref:3-oxoacyl-[acyl-carrier-protein] synthase III C-terminal domain-containing protein n=1 Tax=Actinomadura terrae TaxID=604353 RepID=UPI001FA7904C|nr:3-oxoacyl-[acyl-carrier-protein] synthase III C-terminal domain-containing protein [Actinomadura terrae]
MPTIDAVAIHFPERETTVEERADAVGLNPAQRHLFRRVHGLDRLRYDPDLGPYDLVLPPARKVLAGEDPDSVRYLLYAHASPVVSPSTVDSAEEIRRRLGLRRATACALTAQSCAAALSAIDMAGELLRADGDPAARALVVTGEKIYSDRSQVLFNACVLGEGAGSCLVSLNGPGDRVRSFAARTFGEYSDGVDMTPAQHQRAGAERPGVLRELTEAVLALADRTVDDVDLVLPHNANATFWGEAGAPAAMGFEPGRVFVDNIPRYSHCMASDALINYVTARAEGLLRPGRDYLFFAMGLGMSYGAMVFTHTGGSR